MSFLIDPPLLYAAGEAYARGLPESAQGRQAGIAGAGAVGALLAIGALRRPHAVAAVGVVVYPLAFRLGWDRGRRARPRP